MFYTQTLILVIKLKFVKADQELKKKFYQFKVIEINMQAYTNTLFRFPSVEF